MPPKSAALNAASPSLDSGATPELRLAHIRSFHATRGGSKCKSFMACDCDLTCLTSGGSPACGIDLADFTTGSVRTASSRTATAAEEAHKRHPHHTSTRPCAAPFALRMHHARRWKWLDRGLRPYSAYRNCGHPWRLAADRHQVAWMYPQH